MSACKSCGASIIWARALDSGKAIPLNPEPKVGGNLELKDGAVQVVRPSRTIKLYVSHFATCPNANQHRKERRQ